MSSMYSYLFCHGKLEIANEYPENSFQLTLRSGETELILLLDDHDLWWRLRNSLPKATHGYHFTGPGKECTSDHGLADMRACDMRAAHLESIGLFVAAQAIDDYHGRAAE